MNTKQNTFAIAIISVAMQFPSLSFAQFASPPPAASFDRAKCVAQAVACEAVERGAVLGCLNLVRNGYEATAGCFGHFEESYYPQCRAMAYSSTKYCRQEESYGTVFSYFPLSEQPMIGYSGQDPALTGTVKAIRCGTGGFAEQLTLRWGKGSTNVRKPGRLLSAALYCNDGTLTETSTESGTGANVNYDISNITYAKSASFLCDTGQVIKSISTVTSPEKGSGSGASAYAVNNILYQLGAKCGKPSQPVLSATSVFKLRHFGISTQESSRVDNVYSCPDGYAVSGLQFFESNSNSWDDIDSTINKVLLGVRVECKKHID